MVFRDRSEAGRRLGALVREHAWERPVIIGLPRGGVPVAAEVARALGTPLDVVLVRKLGVPGHEELGFGAVAEDGVVVHNEAVVRSAGVTPEQQERALAEQRLVLEQRLSAIRQVHPPVPLTGRTAIVVDDGIATGIDARAACRVARGRGATRVVLAVPVAPAGWSHRLTGEADAFIAVEEPEDFDAVGQFYDEFPQVSDAEVLRSLQAVGGHA